MKYSDFPNIWFIQYLVEQTENGYKLFQINSVAFFHLTIVNLIYVDSTFISAAEKFI